MKKNVQELLLEPAPFVVVFVILTTLEFASIDGMQRHLEDSEFKRNMNSGINLNVPIKQNYLHCAVGTCNVCCLLWNVGVSDYWCPNSCFSGRRVGIIFLITIIITMNHKKDTKSNTYAVYIQLSQMQEKFLNSLYEAKWRAV